MNQHRSGRNSGLVLRGLLLTGGLLLIGGLLLAMSWYYGRGGNPTAADEPAPAGKPWNRNPAPLPNDPATKKPKRQIDVVQQNGKLFVDQVGQGPAVDWPRPKLALLLSGGLSGYIEPCGCAGLENMKGGLSRRQTFINQLTAEGWPLVKFEMGDLVSRVGPQATIKYHRILDGLNAMGYQAIGFGPADLTVPATDLLAAVPTPFVSANVGLLDFDNQYTSRFRVVEAGGMKIGVTSVALAADGKPPQDSDLAYLDPVAALTKVLPKMQAAHCVKLVLLADTTPAKALELARKFHEFDFVVTHNSAGDGEPPRELTPVPGSTSHLVELGHKGMFVGVLAFYGDAARPVRYQLVPLDARFPDSPAMKKLMSTYQDELRDQGFDLLGVRPQPHPRGANFVGSKTCAQCHTAAFAVWQKTPHAHALETLEKLTPPRNFDPECLSCHVTGWDPQEFVPFAGGYTSVKATPELAGNGCENCHGPGSEHVAAESGAAQVDNARRDALRQQMRLTVAEVQKKFSCYSCHDVDNSPDFKFETYWPKIEHHGKD